MFYLKYRPQTIGEIDNTRVKELLRKILESDTLPHAFLFVGQKGTGKTSAARIFAKAINCLNNKFAKKTKSTEPCNECKNCRSIKNSSFTDVLELDAASNRGIEEIKNLIRETAFFPMAGRYRVFIIDEAHMITRDGFNALLKTLEEPPDSAVFILATTNLEKVPKTIQSRCVKVNFGRAKKQDLIDMLKRILKHENKEYERSILELIATHAENSFRDAAKILEELIFQKIVQKEEAEKFLGIRGKNNILEIIESSDTKKTLLWVEEFNDAGGDFKGLIEDLLDQLRELLLVKKGAVQESELATKLSTQEIMLLIKLLMEAYQSLRSTPIESLPLEIALVEFYNRNKKN
jgi:DNA polymerase-3 subunit gamma/tau